MISGAVSVRNQAQAPMNQDVFKIRGRSRLIERCEMTVSQWEYQGLSFCRSLFLARHGPRLWVSRHPIPTRAHPKVTLRCLKAVRAMCYRRSAGTSTGKNTLLVRWANFYWRVSINWRSWDFVASPRVLINRVRDDDYNPLTLWFLNSTSAELLPFHCSRNRDCWWEPVVLSTDSLTLGSEVGVGGVESRPSSYES